MRRVAGRLERLGLTLPEVAPTHEFVGVVIDRDMAYVSGHAPFDHGEFRYRGTVGREFDLDQARDAAELAALGCLASLEASDHLERVARICKVNGYVNCAPDFEGLPRVTDAASDLLVKTFGDPGRHARTTVGVASLPMSVAVEIDMIIRLDLLGHGAGDGQ